MLAVRIPVIDDLYGIFLFSDELTVICRGFPYTRKVYLVKENTKKFVCANCEGKSKFWDSSSHK